MPKSHFDAFIACMARIIGDRHIMLSLILASAISYVWKLQHTQWSSRFIALLSLLATAWGPRQPSICPHRLRTLRVGFEHVKPLADCNCLFEAVPALQGVRPPLCPTRFAVYASHVLCKWPGLSPPHAQHSIWADRKSLHSRDFYPAGSAKLRLANEHVAMRKKTMPRLKHRAVHLQLYVFSDKKISCGIRQMSIEK